MKLVRHGFAGSRPTARDRETGFTLVEMLVVITIIGLIMGLVGPRVLNYLSESKTKTAKIQIESLTAALDLYYLDTGRYPSTSEGLVALIQRPGAAAPAWNGPYLKSASVPADPWGHAYVYRAPAEKSPYEILSYGAKGEVAGAASPDAIKSTTQ